MLHVPKCWTETNTVTGENRGWDYGPDSGALETGSTDTSTTRLLLPLVSCSNLTLRRALPLTQGLNSIILNTHNFYSCSGTPEAVPYGFS